MQLFVLVVVPHLQKQLVYEVLLHNRKDVQPIANYVYFAQAAQVHRRLLLMLVCVLGGSECLSQDADAAADDEGVILDVQMQQQLFEKPILVVGVLILDDLLPQSCEVPADLAVLFHLLLLDQLLNLPQSFLALGAIVARSVLEFHYFQRKLRAVFAGIEGSDDVLPSFLQDVVVVDLFSVAFDDLEDIDRGYLFGPCVLVFGEFVEDERFVVVDLRGELRGCVERVRAGDVDVLAALLQWREGAAGQGAFSIEPLLNRVAHRAQLLLRPDESVALVVRHWVAAHAGTQIGLLVELSDRLRQTYEIVHVEVHIANASRKNLSHLLRTVLDRSCKVGTGFLSRSLSHRVRNPEVSEDKPAEAFAVKNILRLDIFVHDLQAVQCLQVLLQVQLQGFRAEAVLYEESGIFGGTLAEFHGELHAVVEADEVEGRKEHSRADAQHRTNFEEGVLTDGLPDLLVLGLLCIDVKPVHPLRLTHEVYPLHCEFIVPDYHLPHTAEATGPELALTGGEVLFVGIAVDIEQVYLQQEVSQHHIVDYMGAEVKLLLYADEALLFVHAEEAGEVRAVRDSDSVVFEHLRIYRCGTGVGGS